MQSTKTLIVTAGATLNYAFILGYDSSFFCKQKQEKSTFCTFFTNLEISKKVNDLRHVSTK